VKFLRPTHHCRHWVLDVDMNEDRVRSRCDKGPQDFDIRKHSSNCGNSESL